MESLLLIALCVIVGSVVFKLLKGAAKAVIICIIGFIIYGLLTGSIQI